jgi:hypothetical protein
MTKQNVEKALRNELQALNERIDAKIIRGLSYARESRQHKYVLQQLAAIRRSQNRMGLFGRMSFTKAFIF